MVEPQLQTSQHRKKENVQSIKILCLPKISRRKGKWIDLKPLTRRYFLLTVVFSPFRYPERIGWLIESRHPKTEKDYLSDVTIIAVKSRICIIILQFIFNLLIRDHQSDGFISPINNAEKSSYDHIVLWLLGGFIRWDAQHFMHISVEGYTDERLTAFFPGFPFLIHLLGLPVRPLVSLNILSIHLILATFVNCLFFVLSARTLFHVSLDVLKNPKQAYIATIIFCINPASIFFTAPYSEAIFSFFTFRAMLADRCLFSVCYVSLSIIFRSNGLVNVGFPLYRALRLFVQNCELRKFEWVIFLFKTLFSICIPLFVFYSVQSYSIKKLCSSDNGDLNICGSRLPYFYVQNRYWDVDFFSYAQIKQIPNYFLAAPILLFTLIGCIKYFIVNFNPLGLTLALQSKSSQYVEGRMFVYMVHLSFLLFVCLSYVHIQVSTRLLCSSSPVAYWLWAQIISSENEKFVFPPRVSTLSTNTRIILSYCLFYSVLGTALFCNFYPWTWERIVTFPITNFNRNRRLYIHKVTKMKPRKWLIKQKIQMNVHV